MVKRLSVIFFDVDGVLLRGTKVLPHAAKTIMQLRNGGFRIFLLSNNASRTRTELAKKLFKVGIDVSSDEIISSASLTGSYVASQKRIKRVFVAGTKAIDFELRAAGFKGSIIRSSKGRVDAVIAGLNPDFDYLSLSAAQNYVMKGAKFIATNLDTTLLVKNGFLPGAGSLIAAISTAAGKKPDIVIGKPSRIGMRLVLRIANEKAENCLLVGDRLDTDIEAARLVGMRSVLVLTGHSKRSHAKKAAFHQSPDAIISDLSKLNKLL